MGLRVILLKKTSLINDKEYKTKLELKYPVEGPWVTLGHFDAMYSYALNVEGQNVFTAIRENNYIIAKEINESNYYHPLYLLSNENDSEFWKKSTWFMAVTRIHFKSSILDSKEVDALSDYILEKCNNEDCMGYIYKSLELSDLTLVVKSNRISNMLSAILNLWSHPSVGKIYTYCGVNYGHLMDKSIVAPEHDDVDFLSIRFAVRSPNGIGSFFDIVKNTLGTDPIYSVTGVDDIILNFYALPVSKLVRFFRYWLVEGLPQDIDLCSAFSGITTRLGTKYKENIFVGEKNDSNKNFDFQIVQPITKMCEHLVDLSLDMLSLADGKLDSCVDLYWIKKLTELSYSLLRLSRTPLLDEFVYLMFPGVNAFLSNMVRILNSNNSTELISLDKTGCQHFVENLFHLMEHVMRTEGQLAHHPEIRPIICDIPLAMLEHILAFLSICVKVLKMEDLQEKQIEFILFPKLCNRIETEELFSSEENRIGLLSIAIPFHLLYDPKMVQIALCHEVSHFIGEKNRNRYLRKTCYIKTAAAIIAHEAFDSNDDSLVLQIEKSILKSILLKDADMYRISNLELAIIDWVDILFHSEPPEEYCNLVRNTYREFLTKKDTVAPRFNAIFKAFKEKNSSMIGDILHFFTQLFREIYADICMISLLDVDEKTYFESLYDDIIKNPDAAGFYALRIYTVLSSVKKQEPLWLFDLNDTSLNDFFFYLTPLFCKCNSENSFSTVYPFPDLCVKYLAEYSQKCAQDISCNLKKNAIMREKTAELRKMYSNVNEPNMECDLLQKHINLFRRDCIKEIE